MIEEVVKKEVAKAVQNTVDQVVPRHLKKVTGLVTEEEKSPVQKFINVLVEEDFRTVKRSLIQDVVIPTIRDFLADIFIGGIERTLYGGSGVRRHSRSSQTPSSYSSSLVRPDPVREPYYNMYGTNKAVQKPQLATKVSRFDFSDVVMRDRASAQDLLDILRLAIAEQGYVTVGELYDALDKVDDLDFTDNYYGWRDLSGARIKRVFSGYWLDLPDPVQI